MMKKFKELMMKKMKEGKVLKKGSKEHKAKSDVLKEISEMMKEMTGEKLKGMKKVTVMSPTSEGLEEGLEKAAELLEAKEEMGESKEDKEDQLEKLKKLVKNKE